MPILSCVRRRRATACLAAVGLVAMQGCASTDSARTDSGIGPVYTVAAAQQRVAAVTAPQFILDAVAANDALTLTQYPSANAAVWQVSYRKKIIMAVYATFVEHGSDPVGIGMDGATNPPEIDGTDAPSVVQSRTAVARLFARIMRRKIEAKIGGATFDKADEATFAPDVEGALDTPDAGRDAPSGLALEAETAAEHQADEARLLESRSRRQGAGRR